MRLRLLLFFLASRFVAAEDVPLQAVVGSPVIQELMGGCSLRCAFPWSVESLLPSGKRSVDYATNDSCAETAWIDEAPSHSVGTKLIFRFPSKLPPELQGTPLFGMDVANGFSKSEEAFHQYARLKLARMTYNGKPVHKLSFKDTPRWQKVTFDEIPLNAGDWIGLEVLEVYPGAKTQRVAITEIVLQGTPPD